ncbi:MAG TPA: DNA/RNA non-specific endonuclease, partial [Bacteroidia bacterium]|nr:DNA/RNA non-specific endonuclease [Bacteroidia bacterium]
NKKNNIMRKLLLIPLIFFFSISYGQDTVVLKHEYFTSIFVEDAHIPALVEYYLTDDMLKCDEHLERGRFAKDPLLPVATNLDKDYTGSGYDRGHNMSSKNNDCFEDAMKECFYFSNMFPQTHKLNAGAWYKLEVAERGYAEDRQVIKVFIGSLGEVKTIGKTNKISVPEYCWKVIYFPDTKEYECYIFPNDTAKQKDFATYKVELTEIEKKSKMKFKADKVSVSSTINQYK